MSVEMTRWPRTDDELIARQIELATATPEAWAAPGEPYWMAACFVCFQRAVAGRGAAGEPAWAGAALALGGRVRAAVAYRGNAGSPYEAGLLARREGPLLEAALRLLPRLPDVILVNATGRDHPRRAGLALHLGAVMGLPSVGITHRPLLASGAWPPLRRGVATPLLLDGENVGFWLRTRSGRRPLAVHAGWRTDPTIALAVVEASLGRARTPEVLRRARRAARVARGGATTTRKLR